ncbi:WSC domain-containing [Hyphodiscus hymeniophilus]|uniref:WSC domain-containing n=1 Tax=Hyphodiscus hymeniophilus TaxID=353542 RepID=A0A9P6VMQ9_9HELO|nr:WSC domain-containing [Hyphodiscus hymeniophilus]
MTLRCSILFLSFELALIATCMTIKRETSTIVARSSWNSLGCYTDNVSGRALPNSEAVPGGSAAMTNEACQSTCLAAGFSIAGTEYGRECWCGNALVNGGAPVSDGCNMACNGNSAETCGGSNRLNVYQDTSPSTPTSTGKRGLVYNNNNPAANAEYADLFKGYSKISWGYDWGFPSFGLDASFEFVPMLWGLPSGSDPAWTAAVQTPGTKSILGYNEPDLTYSGSSNILPAAAAAGYETYMEPFSSSVKISTPNVLWNNVGSSSGGAYDSKTWMQYFMGNCTCHFDFAAIHYYQDCFPADGQSGAAWFQGNVTDAYQRLGLPVWITEFQCYGTDAQQVAFLQSVLPWLDAQSYVARYAYFGVFPDYLVNTAGTGLSDIGIAFATT